MIVGVPAAILATMLVIGATVVATVNGPSVTAERIGQLSVAPASTPPSLGEPLEEHALANITVATTRTPRKDRTLYQAKPIAESY
jgi:hypothetical protein